MSQARFIHANLLLALLWFNVSEGYRRGQTRRRFLLSALLLGSPFTMSIDVTQNPNSGETRHAIRQGSHPSVSH